MYAESFFAFAQGGLRQLARIRLNSNKYNLEKIGPSEKVFFDFLGRYGAFYSSCLIS